MVNEENRSGTGEAGKQSAGTDPMQALIEQRMARYKEIAKYIGAGAAVYILFMVWYMMHQ